MQPLAIELKRRDRVRLLPKFYKRKLREVDSKLASVIGVLCLIFVVFPLVFGLYISEMNNEEVNVQRLRTNKVVSSNMNTYEDADWKLDYRFPLVECHTTVNVGDGILRIQLNRDWAPKGVERFENLVRDGYYDDIPFFRGVKNFLVQFGASSHVDRVRKWQHTIEDDPQLNPRIPFTDGIVSFAGYGENSRSNQVFFSLGENARLGTKSPWEVPIGQVTEDTLDVAHAVYTGYGDDVMKALGPFKYGWRKLVLTDAEKDKDLKNFFNQYPMLDWIKSCTIIKGGLESLGFHP